MIYAHNSDIKTAFYNDRVKEIVDASLIAEPFTYVPIVAGHMELVEGNAVVFGNITEGYDVVAPDVNTEITYENISLDQARIDIVINKTQTASGTTHYPLMWNSFTQYHIGDYVRGPVDGYVYRAQMTSLGVLPVPEPNPAWVLVFWNATASYRIVGGVMIINIPFQVYEGSLYYITIQNTAEGLSFTSVSYLAQSGDTYINVRDGLLNELWSAGFVDAIGGAQSGPWANCIYLCGRTKYYQNSPTYETGDINTVFKDFDIHAYILSVGDTIKFPQLKCGAVHSFGIVYKDRSNRVCSVMRDDTMNVYIPFYTEMTDAQILETIQRLKFFINHTPPAWAESYEIVYYGNISMDYFMQIRISDITEIPNGGGNRFSINVLSTFEWTWNKNNRWKVAGYEWEAGDRMRLFGLIADDGSVSPIYYGEAIGAGFVYDYEIESTGTQYNEEAIGGDWLIMQAVQRPTPFEGATNILTEIYRPRKGFGETIAYGTGMVFGIGTDIYGHKYHKGDVDQILDADGENDTPAEVVNTANDCWKFLRLNYKHETNVIQPFWAESIFPSDWWAGQDINNKLTSAGFPFLDDLSQRQMVLSQRFRHGGFLITGTRTNNIAHFTYNDYKDLPEKDGEIIGIRQIGFTLKIVQKYKETSIYINRVQTFNPDGTEQFTLTDSFIGTIRPMENDYGSQHPDSILVNNRYLYYWDDSQGELIRSAANGQITLSGPEYKMSRWFKDLAKWIKSEGGANLLDVQMGANNEHEEVWVSFRMGDSVQGIIFSEKKGRFTSRIDLLTESYVHLGNFFAHLYHQRLWIMNVDEGQDYLSWNGVERTAEIEIVSNIEPLRNKIYNAVALFSDHQMSSLPLSVFIPQEGSAGNSLMETNIPLWDRREGIFFGEILKDVNSKGNFLNIYDRKMNGNAMRGRFCYVRLTTEEHTEKVRIDSIVVFSTMSERNV